MDNTKPRVNDFFCGAGGVCVGFRNAGYNVIWACDFDKYAVQTYKHNLGDHVVQADITLLNWNEIPTAEVWAFGFPCQDLSLAGVRDGLKLKCKDCETEFSVDPATYDENICCPKCGCKNNKAANRSGLFFEMMRLLDETKEQAPERMPQALFIENVKGLKDYIPVLEAELAKRGYEAHVTMYNSKYWDVPQSRERYYIVGTAATVKGFDFPEEQHEHIPKLSTALDKDVDEKYFISDEKAQTIIQQALERLEKLGTVHATITPDRVERRQNGRRAKGDEEEMFTLTAQDLHGVIICEGQGDEPVIIQTARGKNDGGIHTVAPTLTSNAYQENNFVCESVEQAEKAICEETGLLSPDGCGKTLRCGGVAALPRNTTINTF